MEGGTDFVFLRRTRVMKECDVKEGTPIDKCFVACEINGGLFTSPSLPILSNVFSQCAPLHAISRNILDRLVRNTFRWGSAWSMAQSNRERKREREIDEVIRQEGRVGHAGLVKQPGDFCDNLNGASLQTLAWGLSNYPNLVRPLEFSSGICDLYGRCRAADTDTPLKRLAS